MAVYQILTLLYILDYFWVEAKMTSTWDMIAENFGLMLVWGDFVFIPFYFSLQAWCLLEGGGVSTWPQLVLCFGIFVLGYCVFRGANSQKDGYKTYGAKFKIWGKPVETVGGRLLVSGFWGIARHSNYLGDILIAIGFSSPCWGVWGLKGLLGWAYPTYLTILLLWRERRDDERCAQKYTKIWKEYCDRVPYRILPFVY